MTSPILAVHAPLPAVASAALAGSMLGLAAQLAYSATSDINVGAGAGVEPCWADCAEFCSLTP